MVGQPLLTTAVPEKQAMQTTSEPRTARSSARLLKRDTIHQFGIGTLRVRHLSKADSSRSFPHSRIENQQEKCFHLSSWLLNWGIDIICTRAFGKLQVTMRPCYFVSWDSTIFKECVTGDIEAVRHLFATGKASPFDSTHDGMTPLHVSGFMASHLLGGSNRIP